jgi:LysR family glycine cleavage system transcriptional activator
VVSRLSLKAARFDPIHCRSPDSEPLLQCESFPVCSPALARSKAHAIRTPDDLSHYVRLDYETLRDGRRLSEWDFWFDTLGIRRVKPASTLRFPQYDQLAAAAVEGSGVAMGVLPHLAPQLREGILCAPFGREGVAHRGAFFVICRPDVAERDAVRAFVAWLRGEVRREDDFTLPSARSAQRRPRASNARRR